MTGEAYYGSYYPGQKEHRKRGLDPERIEALRR